MDGVQCEFAVSPPFFLSSLASLGCSETRQTAELELILSSFSLHLRVLQATHLLTSSTDSSLRLFTLPPKNQPSGPIAFAGLASRSTGVAIRCGVFDKTGLRIACASESVPSTPVLRAR